MTGRDDKNSAMTVDRDKRWEEIQAMSRKIASKPGVPTETESALCGAVVRARDWLAELEATKELFAAHAARSSIEANAHAELDKADVSRKHSRDGGATWIEYSLAERISILAGGYKIAERELAEQQDHYEALIRHNQELAAGYEQQLAERTPSAIVAKNSESPDEWYARERTAFIAWWESEGQKKFSETTTLAAGAGWFARADAIPEHDALVKDAARYRASREFYWRQRNGEGELSREEYDKLFDQQADRLLVTTDDGAEKP